MATFRHDLKTMLRTNGFKPTKRGGYKMHKRRDGVIELMVCKGKSKKPLRAWYRAERGGELFVQSGEFERVPPWVIGRARANAGKGGASRATTGFLTHGGHQYRAIRRRRGEEEEEEREEQLSEALAAAKQTIQHGGITSFRAADLPRATGAGTQRGAPRKKPRPKQMTLEESGMTASAFRRAFPGAKRNPTAVRRAFRKAKPAGLSLVKWVEVEPGTWDVVLRNKSTDETVAGMLHASGKLWLGGYGEPAPRWAKKYDFDGGPGGSGFGGSSAGRTNPAKAWDIDLTVPQLWRAADGGSYPAMVELKRIGAYRPEIGKQAQWTKGMRWAKNNRGQARKNTTASPQARGFTFMHADMGQEWAEWALSRQGIKHRTGAVAKANRSRRGRKRYQHRKQAALHSKGSGPRGGYTAAERGALAKKWFLKPKSRTWPVADPRHAVIAIQYMTAGRGKRSEYPTLIRRLAKLWPLRQNKAIWEHYRDNRTKIARKAGRPMPTLNALDKG